MKSLQSCSSSSSSRSFINLCFVLSIVFLSTYPSDVQAFVSTSKHISPPGITSCKHVAVSRKRRSEEGSVFTSQVVKLESTTASISTNNLSSKQSEMNPLKASLTKVGMIAYIASMCVALPITLFPAAVLHKTKIISKTRKEKMSLRIGQFCSRWLMRVIPFAKVQVLSKKRKPAIKKFFAMMSNDLEKAAAYFAYFEARATPHQRGENDRGWKATFDFIIREDVVTRAIEGTL
jgi:hypothetical protein